MTLSRLVRYAGTVVAVAGLQLGVLLGGRARTAAYGLAVVLGALAYVQTPIRNPWRTALSVLGAGIVVGSVVAWGVVIGIPIVLGAAPVGSAEDRLLATGTPAAVVGLLSMAGLLFGGFLAGLRG